MSFYHPVYAGHFDPDDLEGLFSRPKRVVRPIDLNRLQRMLGESDFDDRERGWIRSEDGYVEGPGTVPAVLEFMARFAAEEGCVVMDEGGNFIDAAAIAQSMRDFGKPAPKELAHWSFPPGEHPGLKQT